MQDVIFNGSDHLQAGRPSLPWSWCSTTALAAPLATWSQYAGNLDQARTRQGESSYYINTRSAGGAILPTCSWHWVLHPGCAVIEQG